MGREGEKGGSERAAHCNRLRAVLNEPPQGYRDVVREGRIGPTMAELHEYTQYQCDRCGFRTRSPDEDEAVEIAMGHVERKHGETIDEAGIRDELRTLELEGYPKEA